MATGGNILASRKRNYRSKQGVNRYNDGFNQQSYYNNHRPSQQSGHRENQYYCDICDDDAEYRIYKNIKVNDNYTIKEN